MFYELIREHATFDALYDLGTPSVPAAHLQTPRADVPPPALSHPPAHRNQAPASQHLMVLRSRPSHRSRLAGNAMSR